VTLGLDSAFSMTEAILASIVDKTGWRRSIVLPVLSVVGFLFGLIYVTKGGFNWLGTIDGFVNGTWGIAFMGLLECVVLGWLWRIRTLRRHASSRSDWKVGKWWDYLIRLVIPVALGTLFFWQLFEDNPLKREFWMTADGQWILTNCVGMGVIALVPVAAIILSLAKGRRDVKDPERPEQGLVASWLARWAGIMAAMDTSAAIAIILIGLADGAAIEQTTPPIRDELSGVSYVILAVVFLIIVGGLGWCFYRALAAAGRDMAIQHPDEVGDE